jgi:hypothetical protein
MLHSSLRASTPPLQLSLRSASTTGRVQRQIPKQTWFISLAIVALLTRDIL